MKKFRKSLKSLKESREKELDAYNKKLHYTIMLQRAIRMKYFRINLCKLIKQRDEFLKLQETVIKCQKWFRYKKFRQSLIKLKENKLSNSFS